jgi:AcrR family transcriptional regulator
MESKQYHHGDLRAELVQKGLQILDAEGYEGFSLRKVAAACGVSQTAPYRHFKNKENLIAEIVLQAMRAFNDSLASAAEKHPGNPGNQIREMGVAYVRFFAENPQYLRLLFLSDIHTASEAAFCDAKAHLAQGHPFGTFISAIQRYKEAAPSEGRSTDELLVYCWGLVHGIAVLAARREIPEQHDILALASRIIWNERFL